MNTAELRKAFLDFFAERDHRVVASSPLVPGNDPTLLFTNAGMVQFKDVFLGQDKRDYARAATSQRCVRAGGKHNDLENVGYTARHHTFFEMLGNFSFGDYFKRDAIRYAWEFMTEVLGLPQERLWVTVFRDDDEAADIWLKEIGVSPERFARMGEKDNFWSMGDTGPCGPCSEIFYDHGPEVAGGPPGSPDEDGDRYVEVWNLVFMQYNRDEQGNQTELPRPSVDTGMGLERIAAVMQGVHSNYEIDLFARLIEAAMEVTGQTERDNASLRVIADHIRACAFLIVDGVVPDKVGRGYVLRRIVRRAVRHGYKLGVKEPFLYRLVAPLAELMGDAYPELRDARERVERVLRQEEEQFARTVTKGMRMLEEVIAGQESGAIDGRTVFKLYDTFGFPKDLTADIAREHGLTIDEPGFDAAMAEQQARSRSLDRFNVDLVSDVRTDAETEFAGYDSLQGSGVIAELYDGDRPVDSLAADRRGVVIVDRTPFYAESGGQVGDAGELLGPDGAVFAVYDTRKFGRAHGHVGRVEGGVLRVGDRVELSVDGERREATVLNHSATHLLHAALRRVLGDHVTQQGSLVAPDRLRFDFSHDGPVSERELDEIEDLVNQQIRANATAETKMMALDEALASGAMSLFGEKYDDRVRVLALGDFSTELCGGTHVARVGDIGLFRILSEAGIAAGVRRVEAVTGRGAIEHMRESERVLRRVGVSLKAGREEVAAKLEQLLGRSRAQEKEIDALKQKLVGSRSGDLAGDATEVNGFKVVAARMDGADAKQLREAVDRLKNQLGTSVVVLSAVEDGKVRLVAGVSKDGIDRIKAGDLVSAVAEKVGGRGGGRPDMAMAGGTDPAGLEAALGGVVDWVKARTQ